MNIQRDSQNIISNLHALIQNNQVDKFTDELQHALEKKIDVNTQLLKQFGSRLLHFAFLNNQSSEFAKLLLRHGADIYAENDNKQIPLTLAIEDGRLDVICFLLENEYVKADDILQIMEGIFIYDDRRFHVEQICKDPNLWKIPELDLHKKLEYKRAFYKEFGVSSSLLEIKESDRENTYTAELYKELFEGEQASKNADFHDNITNFISRIEPIQTLSEKILGHSPNLGICNALCSFIAAVKPENKKDFDEIMETFSNESHERITFYNKVNEKDFSDYLQGNTQDLSKEDIFLFATMIVENLSILNTKNAETRKELSLDDNVLFFETLNECNEDKQVQINLKVLKEILEKASIGDYVQFGFGVGADNTSYAGHAVLVNKSANDRYLFFDPNVGAIGFDKNGTPDLTLEQLSEVMENLFNTLKTLTYKKNDSLQNAYVGVVVENTTRSLDKIIESHREKNQDCSGPRFTFQDIKIENIIDKKATPDIHKR
ncbi:ankyrin repeat domain-containing protein [Wolbachia endosymbiont of Folsomia candida]|uniref:ankyrin repeat domain-containing protein n=1 Tax=Wolbachia endosymbiont of Folsomia candida TaxID=169402 RepID=UPI000A7BA17E|nr:ankyrin repeat domain-containing protein [Wolbachia endosymbiont of Folsomia candida]APR98734.1 hypothetical protein ASM33_05850 [Wolbachia endosymbiont of Folsomia candida]